MLCTLHGAALPSNVTWIVPRLVAKSATTVLVGAGFGSGGNPVFFKFGFWARSALVYPHGPVVLLETNAEGDEDADADADEDPAAAVFVPLSLVTAMTTTTTTTTRMSDPATVAISIRRFWVASCSCRCCSWRSRWRRAASRRCLLVGTKAVLSDTGALASPGQCKDCV